jgi:MFS family permease
LLLLYPLIQGRSAGWPPGFFVLLACAAPVFAAFVLWERRLTERQADPLIDLTLFHAKSFRTGLLVGVAQSFGAFPTFFTIALTLQIGFGFDPLKTAIATAPVPFGVVMMSMLSARLVPRFGRRLLGVAGILGVVAAITIYLTFLHASRPLNALVLVPALLVLGFNNGMAMSSIVNLTLADVEQRHAGSASGVMQTAQQSMAAFGVAVVGILYFGVVGSRTSIDAYVAGLGAAMGMMVVSSTAVFILHFFMPDHVRRPASEEDVVAAEGPAV